MKPRVFLELGRVSNLPTVWTDALAGLFLAGGAPWPVTLAALLAFSLMYAAGMFLNDAFDRRWDALHRSERPIPSGRIGARPVFMTGFALLAAGVGLAALASPRPLVALVCALALAAAIVVYNAGHKGVFYARPLMGLCRALVYIGAACVAQGRIPLDVLLAALCALLYVTGLSGVASHESTDGRPDLASILLLAAPLFGVAAALLKHPLLAALPALAFVLWTAWAVFSLLPKNASRAVAALIAGLCLYDATLLAGWGRPVIAAFATAFFGLTLLLQRRVPAT